MPDIPTVSNFAATGDVDTPTTLSVGAVSGTTVLISDLTEDMILIAKIDDASSANRKGGVILVEEEIIYYGLADSSSPNDLYDLIRGQEGTIPVLHSAGAPVTIFGAAKFHNPAIVDAIISMQETIKAQADTIADLNTRLEALEP